MNDKKLRLIHTVCGCVISAALIVAAACLIVSAYTIYNLGDSPYTPESIGAEYAKIAVPLWVAIFAVIAGILLNILLPMPKIKSKSDKDPFIKLRILQKKLPADCTHTGIARQRSIRKIARTVCALLCTIAFIPAIAVLCDYGSFTVDNLTPALLRVVGMLALGAVISGIILLILSVIERKSATKEIEWTKIALSANIARALGIQWNQRGGSYEKSIKMHDAGGTDGGAPCMLGRLWKTRAPLFFLFGHAFWRDALGQARRPCLFGDAYKRGADIGRCHACLHADLHLTCVAGRDRGAILP